MRQSYELQEVTFPPRAPFQQADAVTLGQAYIGKHQRHIVLHDFPPRRRLVGGRQGIIARLPQPSLKHVAENRVVLHHKYRPSHSRFFQVFHSLHR